MTAQTLKLKGEGACKKTIIACRKTILTSVSKSKTRKQSPKVWGWDPGKDRKESIDVGVIGMGELRES